jgi:hypothetical protein
VRHGADKSSCRIARQQRIGVQRDDVLHFGQQRGVADDERKAIPGSTAPAAAQQRVQVRKLAALALVAHPDPFPRVPAPRAMEQVEDVAVTSIPAGTVFGIQLVYPRLDQRHQRPVLGE